MRLYSAYTSSPYLCRTNVRSATQFTMPDTLCQHEFHGFCRVHRRRCYSIRNSHSADRCYGSCDGKTWGTQIRVARIWTGRGNAAVLTLAAEGTLCWTECELVASVWGGVCGRSPSACQAHGSISQRAAGETEPARLAGGLEAGDRRTSRQCCRQRRQPSRPGRTPLRRQQAYGIWCT